MEKLGTKIKGAKIYGVFRTSDGLPMAFTADEDRAKILATVLGVGFEVKEASKKATTKEALSMEDE